MTRLTAVAVLCLAFTLTACRLQGDTLPDPTRSITTEATATATPAPPVLSPTPIAVATLQTPEAVAAAGKEMIICQATEPDSLYLYGSNTLAAQNVRHAIYENLYTQLGYDYQAQGLRKLPNLADSDAAIRVVEVEAGATVVDVNGRAVTLADGVQVRDAAGEVVTFAGTALALNQMQADFTFRPLVWSDGRPVTAGDSVFSFQLAATVSAPADDSRVARTAAYEVIGPLTVRWTGWPGWLDPDYFLNVWMPLPAHELQGYTPAELLQADVSARRPLAHGPFMVTEWVAGEHIKLARNPYYYRAGEGLPYLDHITFRFISEPNELMTQLLAGSCHIGAPDAIHLSLAPFLQEAQSAGFIVPHFVRGTAVEQINFGIDPAPEDDVPRRPWFTDARVRQAMIMCTNRQRIVDEALFGIAEIVSAYIPATHPFYPDDLAPWSYSVAAANVLLDEVGYLDNDGDGIREFYDGIPFELTLVATDVGLQAQVAELFAADMRACGILVRPQLLPAADFFAEGPEGQLYGRRFDLALFAQPTGIHPPCDLYSGDQIPGPPEEDYAAGWQGSNVSGWRDDDYDAACRAAQQALYGSPDYATSHQTAVRLFVENVPTIPLFAHVKTAVVRPEVLNFSPDATQPSVLWNLFALDIVLVDSR